MEDHSESGSNDAYVLVDNARDLEGIQGEHLVGPTLVDLASKRGQSRGKEGVSDHDGKLIEECFVVGGRSTTFKDYHIQALKAALQNENYELARLLLSKDPANSLLTNENDILQAAIIAKSGWQDRWIIHNESLRDMLELLLSHGANVNAMDSEGNTALYYTCAGGHLKAFKFLIGFGADYSTLHDPVPSKDIDAQPPNPGSGKQQVNLLQIAFDSRLEAENGLPIPRTWVQVDQYQQQWGEMIMVLIDKGLSFRRDDPSVSKFFQVACWQGNMPYIQNLLGLGVDINARAGISDDRDYIYGTAIHVAVAAGQKDVVLLLLEHGAEVGREAMCSTSLSKRAFATPIACALNNRFSLATTEKVLDCCEILIEKGANEEDAKLVLAEAAKKGNVEMVKRLLGRGIPITDVPMMDSIDTIRVLLDNGCRIDSAKFQREAVGKGNLEFLKLLVKKDGPLLQDKDFGYIAYDVIRGKHVNTLLYLLREYRWDINKPFVGYPGGKEKFNFLQRAVQEHSLEFVQLLLKEGADPTCPGLPDNILEFFRKSLENTSMSVRLIAKYMPIVKLLVHHSTWYNGIVDGRFYPPGWQPKPRKKLAGAPATTLTYGSNENVEMLVSQPESTGPQITVTYVGDDSFPFKPLKGLDSIRLLELQPSNSPEEPIKCRLIFSHLSQKPQYEILSHDLDDGARTHTVTIDGKTWKASTGLWHGLKRVRLANEPRLLWSQEICVDHGNIHERNEQISQLKDIYKTANQVLVWLGEEADDSHLITEHFEDWNKYVADVKAGRVSDSWFGKKDILNIRHYQGQTRDAFLELCKRRWFHSIWSAYAPSAKRTTLICGRDEWDLNQFIRPTSFREPEQAFHPLRGVDGPSHLEQLQRIGEHAKVRDVLLHSRHCQVPDPRDKIFAMVGLMEKHLIPVNYNASVVEAFRDFTQASIKSTRDLHLLHMMGTRRQIPGLPSWVPDFSISQPGGCLPRGIGGGTYSMNFPWHVRPGLEFRGSDMILKGRYIESVQAVGEVLIADPSYEPGSAHFANVMHSWETLAVSLKKRRFLPTVTNAYLETLRVDDWFTTISDNDTSRHVDEFVRWYDLFGAGVLAEEDEGFFDELEETRAWALWAGMEEGNGDVSYFGHCLELVCYDRRFFLSDQGSMGMAPPGAQAGDEIVFFPGGLYPFVVRKEEGGTYHQLIGDCYLYNFDVYGLFEDQAREEKQYTLR